MKSLPRNTMLRYWMIGLILSAAGLPLSAFAGTLYKCVGPNGQIAFTNRVETFGHCEKVASYSDTTPKSSAASTVDPHSEYRSEPASAAANVAQASAASSVAAQSDSATEIHRGAVYKIHRTNGITEYTNIRPSGSAYQILFTYMSTCFACSVHSTIDWKSTPLNVNAYRDEIAAAAAEYGVDPALLRAVIHAESAFNPNAISVKGAQGLMQLMPGTASDLGVDNPFDVSQNIRGGAQYLASLLRQFNGDERLATAAYDAGAQNVQKYRGVPPFDETQVYVNRVATLRQRYHSSE